MTWFTFSRFHRPRRRGTSTSRNTSVAQRRRVGGGECLRCLNAKAAGQRHSHSIRSRTMDRAVGRNDCGLSALSAGLN